MPPPAQVTWWYRSAADHSPAQFAQVKDGTGGFRRSGVVRLPLPIDWQPEGPAQDGLTPYALWIRVAKATFTAPPRLERILPNVAIARHLRQTQEHPLKRTWLPLPGNQLDLAALPEGEPEKDYPPLGPTVRLQLLERSQRPQDRQDAWHDWQPVTDLAFSGPGDRHFVVDRERGLLRFGDGLTGRVPVLARLTREHDVNVKVQYAVGGGSTGNLGDNLCWEGVTDRDLTREKCRACRWRQRAGNDCRGARACRQHPQTAPSCHYACRLRRARTHHTRRGDQTRACRCRFPPGSSLHNGSRGGDGLRRA